MQRENAKGHLRSPYLSLAYVPHKIELQVYILEYKNVRIPEY